MPSRSQMSICKSKSQNARSGLRVNYDNVPDETLGERLMAISEVFPRPIRRFGGFLFRTSTRSVKSVFNFACKASWVVVTAGLVLFTPLFFEAERARQKQEEREEADAKAKGFKVPPTIIMR